MRKRYQKDSLAHMKNSGEIHEQLVTYDEEGGGEMDTNGYVWMQSEMCCTSSLGCMSSKQSKEPKPSFQSEPIKRADPPDSR